jgi:hypothetical protein
MKAAPCPSLSQNENRSAPNGLCNGVARRECNETVISTQPKPVGLGGILQKMSSPEHNGASDPLKLGDLDRARKVIPFFVGRVIRRYPAYLGLSVLMTVLSVGAQLGFLVLLPKLISLFEPAATRADNAQVVPGLEFNSPLVLVGLAFILLVVAAVSDYWQQWSVSRINNIGFRELMRDVLFRLIESRERLSSLGGANVKSLINLFTKGCRYGALTGYRSTRMMRPLLAAPALLAFCIWQSPALALASCVIFMIAVPFHIMLMRRGIVSMRRLIYFGARHATTKKTMITGLLQFPSWNWFDSEQLARTSVDEGSRGYLDAYFDRRMLSATSMLVNSIAIAFGLLVVSILLSSGLVRLTFDLSELLVFVLALRFLIMSIGQIVTDVTMVSSYTPMCEDIYVFLSHDTGDQVLPVVQPDKPYVPKDFEQPGLIIFTPMAQPVPALQRIVSGATRDNEWLKAGVVRGIYPPYFASLSRDLLLDLAPDSSSPKQISLPANRQAILEEALAREATEGWSEALWREIPPSIRLYCTLNAALANNPERVIFLGATQSQFGRAEWQKVQELLSEIGTDVVQVIEAPPKVLLLPKDVRATFFNGQGFEDLGKIENYREFAPTVIERIAQWRQNTMRETTDTDPNTDDVDDLLGEI